MVEKVTPKIVNVEQTEKMLTDMKIAFYVLLVATV